MGKQSTSPQYRSATPTVDAKCLPVCDAAIVTVSLAGPVNLHTPGFLTSVIDQQLIADYPDELGVQRNLWCTASCLILDGEGAIEWGTQSMFDSGCQTEVDLPATLSIGTAQKYLISAAAPIKVIAAQGPCGQGVVSTAGLGEVVITELPPIDFPDIFDSSIAPVNYCTDDADENQVLLCKKFDASGNVVLGFDAFVVDTSEAGASPYTGPIKRCANKTTHVTPWQDDLCRPVIICADPVSGDCEFFVIDPVTQEKLPMSESELNVPDASGSKVFESEVLELIQVQATDAVATVADAIALAVAAGLPDLVCKETGDSTPALEADICSYKVRRMPCKTVYLTDPTDATATAEVGADDSYYVGGVSVNVAEDSFGAIDPTRPVAAGADAVAVWCFKLQRELSKAEIAAL